MDTFHVTDTDGPVILGLPTCKALDLITINYTHDIKTETAERKHSMEQNNIGVEDKAAHAQIMTDYKDCFEGIGCFKGEFHVTVDPNVPPVIHPPRHIPVALQDTLKHELDTLCKTEHNHKSGYPNQLGKLCHVHLKNPTVHFGSSLTQWI